MVTIKKAEQKDIKLLNSFQHKLGEYERPMSTTLKQGEIEYYDVEKLISNKDCMFLLVYDEDTPIGCGMALIAENEGWCAAKRGGTIGMMYLEPTYRNKGIGSKILNQLVQWLEGQNIKDIRLRVFDKNSDAIHAYRSCGFESHMMEMRYVKKA